MRWLSTELYRVLALSSMFLLAACDRADSTIQSDAEAYTEIRAQLKDLGVRIAAGPDAQQLAEMTSQLEKMWERPPLAEIRVMHEFDARRWELEALKLTRKAKDLQARKGGDFLSQLTDHAVVQPIRVNPSISVAFEQAAATFVDQAADAALDGMEAEVINESTGLTEVEIAEYLELIGDWRTQFDRLEANSSSAARRAQEILHGQAVGLQAQWLTDDVPYPAIDGALTDLVNHTEHAMRSRYEQADRVYQQWALKQIELYEYWHYDNALEKIKNTFADMGSDEKIMNPEVFVTFPALLERMQRDLAGEVKIPDDPNFARLTQRQIFDAVNEVHGYRNDTEYAYKVTAHAMVEYLGPINRSLLGRAVGNLYDESYRKGWEKLAGREDRMWVAKQETVTSNKTIDEVSLETSN